MMGSVYAVVDAGVVINMVIWDGESDWKPDSGVAILANGLAGIGWAYNNGDFIPPETPMDDNVK
ncbi:MULTISPECIES: hypothetical protein [Enterobacteriaceae]|uniref:hypothetical protein n=1 Tax=Enterobacteriaceae TaxID=543 RepID=UPI00068EEAA2|nr:MULTISPECIES: hypothetical protein [Enterobacteriaceae]EFC1550357.1 hypothetical protein [Escherichia coli]EFI1504426.1 hypothetical protein [Escherichia coli]EFO4493691.1 hypothetical protein [Escherichia coli]EFU7206704.1 hypothetical protein [Escherichia coli]EHE9934665.1 hypothetical protein [Escherichia coli]